MDKSKNPYFSTRDLMMMAALAALGGIASTYINFIGDFFQSLLGFAGTTQWAAGLHIIWIMLAAALVRKPGAATATGILKGFVEFLSGNTHGLLVLIVDVLAGLIVDVVLLPRRDKQPGLLFYLAAGLSSASNIFVFQFFASIPEDILTFFAILLTSGVAFISGVLFGGLLVKSLAATLRKIGILNDQPIPNVKRKMAWPVGILTAAILITSAAGFFYFKQLGNTQNLEVIGNVANPYSFTDTSQEFKEIEIETELNGVKRSYKGIPIAAIIDQAQPVDRSGLLQISASDGYSFFLSLDEVFDNPNLILSSQKAGKQMLYNVVGANSSKAWVRGVSELKIISSGQIDIRGNISNPFAFIPSDWVGEMDSTYLNMDGESIKMQGIPVRTIWQYSQPADDATDMVFYSEESAYEPRPEEFMDSKDMRIFTLLDENGMSFILGRMNGEVLLKGIQSIEIK